MAQAGGRPAVGVMITFRQRTSPRPFGSTRDKPRTFRMKTAPASTGRGGGDARHGLLVVLRQLLAFLNHLAAGSGNPARAAEG
jgi:hypothetical protein